MSSTKTSAPSMAFWQLASPPILKNKYQPGDNYNNLSLVII